MAEGAQCIYRFQRPSLGLKPVATLLESQMLNELSYLVWPYEAGKPIYSMTSKVMILPTAPSL